MDILVCVKRVPETGAKITVTADGQDVETRNLGFTISPHEECAVEEAVQLIEKHGGSATVLTLGPDPATEQLRGALAMALAMRQAARQGEAGRELLLPAASAAEAALVDGLVVRQAAQLLDVVAALQPEGEALARATAMPRERPAGLPDLADIKGQAGPKRALEIAAAGGHSLLMVGPPGTGKSMLAQRLAGLLPPLDDEAALESAAVLSLAGQFDLSRWGQRPLRAPHHSASSVALVGGGSPPRPGEISLAQHGVLFLDELPEFPRAAL